VAEQELEPGWQRTEPVGGSYAFDLTSGGSVDDADFGHYRPATIEGIKFEDLNGDGHRDLGSSFSESDVLERLFGDGFDDLVIVPPKVIVDREQAGVEDFVIFGGPPAEDDLDSREPGLPGWTIVLELDGNPYATAVTDVEGKFRFSDLPPGN
jgi:hypothetical protein